MMISRKLLSAIFWQSVFVAALTAVAALVRVEKLLVAHDWWSAAALAGYVLIISYNVWFVVWAWKNRKELTR